MQKSAKRPFLALIVAVVAVVLGGYHGLKRSPTTNPRGYECVGDIPTPRGYERIDGDDPNFSAYLRSLPLKPRASRIMYYTGSEARFQYLAYAVINLPLLSNDEQCADVCMRLRGEYLYQSK